MTGVRLGAGVDRRLAAVAAVVMLAGSLLPWLTWSGDLPSAPRSGWDGSGVLVAVAALGTLALLALPWATRESASAMGRHRLRTGSVLEGPLPWLLLVGLAVVGLVVWPLSWLDAVDGLLPHRAPGLYVAIAGTLLLAVATLRRASPRRP